MARLGAFAGAILSIAAATPALADVTISTGTTQNMACSGGVCAPTASSAVLNVADLEKLLEAGATTVTTTGSGVQANNIVVSAALTWTSTYGLTLDAYQSVSIGAQISVDGQAGLVLTTNDGGSNGVLAFEKKGHVAFSNLSSTLTINGTNFTLVDSVQGLASAIAANPAGDYAFARDYNAAKDGVYQSSPIQKTFVGSFEGLGNTILHLGIADPVEADYVGLFAEIGGGIVANLRIKYVDVHARGPNMYVGGLAGRTSGGLATDVSVSGKIVSESGSRNGGLVGLNAGGSISNSFANVAVSGGEYVGGLVGQNSAGGENSTVTDSQAHGAVSSNSSGYEFVGGLVGYNETLGSISGCFATGSVLGGSGGWSGGLVGFNTYGDVSNSYASGAITGGSNSYVGGLVGRDSGGTDASTYSTGAPTGGSGSLVGGLVGYDSPGDIASSYWDTDTSGITNLSQGAGHPPNDPGITGLSTSQFQSGLPSGFDPKIWAENPKINGGLPYLINNPAPQ